MVLDTDNNVDNKDGFTGLVNTQEEVELVIKSYEIATTSKFVMHTSRKGFGKSEIRPDITDKDSSEKKFNVTYSTLKDGKVIIPKVVAIEKSDTKIKKPK